VESRAPAQRTCFSDPARKGGRGGRGKKKKKKASNRLKGEKVFSKNTKAFILSRTTSEGGGHKGDPTSKKVKILYRSSTLLKEGVTNGINGNEQTMENTLGAKKGRRHPHLARGAQKNAC